MYKIIFNYADDHMRVSLQWCISELIHLLKNQTVTFNNETKKLPRIMSQYCKAQDNNVVLFNIIVRK